jgi:hypothetical protein
MADAILPAHLATLKKNMGEIGGLLSIHAKLGGSGPGRRHNLEILNRSVIVLLVACWEAFVEDLAAQAFQALLDGATEPATFPTRVLALASKALRESDDGRDVWRLAGTGWRTVLRSHRDALFERFIGKWNTPKPQQVDDLFEKLVGFSGCSKQWRWRGMGSGAAVIRLESLVSRRGEIAHRVTAGPPARKAEVRADIRFILQLATVTSNAVGSFVAGRIGRRPWPNMRLRGRAG